jgi:hypothetical protein
VVIAGGTWTKPISRSGRAGRQTLGGFNGRGRSSVLANWGGAFAYCIVARELEKFLVIRHTIVGGTFDEYLLGPGYFCYTLLGQTMFVTYATSYDGSRYEYVPVTSVKGTTAVLRWKAKPL